MCVCGSLGYEKVSDFVTHVLSRECKVQPPEDRFVGAWRTCLVTIVWWKLPFTYTHRQKRQAL